MTSFSTKHIEYLERSYLDQLHGVEDAPVDFFMPDTGSISFVKISGISRFWEQHEEKIFSSRHLMEDFIAGLYGEKMPLIYLIIGEPSKINLFIGSYQIKHDEELYNENLSTLTTSLQSAYPGIDIQKEEFPLQDTMKNLNYAGIMIGTPTVKVGSEEIGVEQIERLIRGMYGTKWAYVVIATPVDEQDITKLYNSTLNELRVVEDAERSATMQSPIAEKYKELLDVFLKKIEAGKMQGMWHTAVYFLTQDIRTFNHAKAIVKSVFGGEESRPDPVRVLECHSLKEKICRFAQMTTPAPQSPGKVQYPFKYLSLLNSKELTSLIHMPTEEMPGYFVRDDARFDVASHYKGKGNAIEIGEIIDRGNRMGYKYRIKLKHLNRHGLIVGATGSGKTNTIFYLLRQIWQMGIPFMVIEPAKTEYRKLLQSEIGEDLQVFTLGDDTVSPFRLNPFEIMPGVSVQTHIDHLKSVFNASFIMYAPMPYVLERCIHEIYEDKGWDLATNKNERGFHRNAQPTLTDLYRKIDEVVDRLGYETKITMDVKAALKTRINSLRIGGKGLMLDTRKSTPIEILLRKPTILELEQIGDDDEKAFLIGLLLMFLYEYYVSQGLKEGAGLRHITVVEEAHRLFKNIPAILDTEVANMRGKAVETFCNILSEIRAYGEGFLIAEQIPTKLAPDIIKNTNLKIMHRIVAEDDRVIVGEAMNMDEDQKRYIASLNVGEAAVYGEGDDSPILIKVPYSKIESSWDKTEENRIIRELMRNIRKGMGDVFLPFDGCQIHCTNICKYKKEAEYIVEDAEFMEILSRYILSVVVSDVAITNDFPQVLQTINKLRKSGAGSGVVLCSLIGGIDHYFENKGWQYGWRYEDVDNLKKEFLSLVCDIALDRYKNSTPLAEEERDRIKSFSHRYKELCRRDYDPFSGCERVCPDGYCLYRYNVESLLSDARLDRKFVNTIANYSGEDMWKKLGEVCKIAVRRIVSSNAPAEVKRRVAVCFAIQKSETMPYLDLFLREKIVTSMINLFKSWGGGNDRFFSA